jgi:SAM-dependent methyltransferase
VDIKILQNIITNLISSSMRELRDDKDLLDSFSPNQFKSKLKLINHIENLNILNEDSEIVIFGCWYGSILIPAFYNKVKKITAIDIDPKVISRAKYNLFKDTNVDFISKDVFDWAPDSSRIKKTDLIINTSCEHMRSMKELKLDTKSYFAYTSNNMYDIEGHINCVSSIEEFKSQLPDNAKVMIEDSIVDERGTRFLLIGKYE